MTPEQQNSIVNEAITLLNQLPEQHSIVKHSELVQLLDERNQLLAVDEVRQNVVSFLQKISPVIKLALGNNTGDMMGTIQNVWPIIQQMGTDPEMMAAFKRVEPLLELNQPTVTALPEQNA